MHRSGSTAAGVIRRAMAAAGLTGRMLLQVHDELLFEVPQAEAEPTIATVRAVMENAPLPPIHLSVPLTVDAGQGESWAEAH